MVGKHLSVEQRREARRLGAEGLKTAEIARGLGCSLTTVNRVLAGQGKREARASRWCPSPARLSSVEREEISRGLQAGLSFTAIASRLGRATSTVSREVNANGGRDRYRACSAQDRAWVKARRPKQPKLACPRLAAVVTEWLEEWWSPEEIACRLRVEFPDDPMMWVSHETIYQSLYVQGRGALRRELALCLRTGRALRKPRRRADERRGRISGMINISERPAEADDRAVPGHWEGDLIMGVGNRSAIGTLVERSTRYCLLLHLPHGFTAELVRDAMIEAIQGLPAQLRRSLTWDQGHEMSRHAQISLATDLDIYFCDPHSPWQRGSNENTNGLLRQYFPKGTNLAIHDKAHLEAVAAELNDRPRMTLGWRSPAQALREVLSTQGQTPGVATTP